MHFSVNEIEHPIYECWCGGELEWIIIKHFSDDIEKEGMRIHF